MRLMICEKKDQASQVAKVLGLRQARGAFSGQFQGDELNIVWASGHLITLCPPDKVNESISWQDPATLTPVPRDVPRQVVPDRPKLPKQAQPRYYLANIEQYLRKKPKEVILATDADREGEAIGWMILEHFNYQGPVRRAWMAAGLDKKSVQDAAANLRPPEKTKGWYRAAEARARADWVFMLLVRCYTFYARHGCFGEKLGQGRGREGVVSAGRVQTPALAMIVRREREIRDFVPQDHWLVHGHFQPAEGGLRAFYKPRVTEEIIDRQPEGVSWQPSKKIPKEGEPNPLDEPLFTGGAQVDAFRERLKQSPDKATVRAYQEGQRKEAPPKTYALSDAQLDIGRALRLDGNTVQTMLEDLYEQGLLSYARTSKPDLPINFFEFEELEGILGAVRGLGGSLSDKAEEVLRIHAGEHEHIRPFTPSVFTKKDLEHHGIVPTHEAVTRARLDNLSPKKGRGYTGAQMAKAYEMVVKRFIQALYPPAVYTTQEMHLEMPVEDILGNASSWFVAKGERLIDPGWRAAFGVGAEKDSTITAAREGEQIALSDVELEARTTQPPKRYTTTTLPKAMENIAREVRDPAQRRRLRESQGLGTPATRKAIIDTLCDRNYVQAKKEVLSPTTKGEQFHDVVEDWLKSPEETALWEDYLVEICNEQDDEKAQKMRDSFVEQITVRIEELIAQVRQQHNGNLRAPRSQGAAAQVTDRMKNAIRTISERKGINPPRGALSDPEKARAFLDEHAGQRDGNGAKTPSEGQRHYARQILDNLPDNVSPPEGVLDDARVCSQFIDEHKGYAPPSKGMLDFARDVAARLDEAQKPDDSVFQYSSHCKQFLDRFGKKGQGAKRKGAGPGRKKRAARKRAAKSNAGAGPSF